MENDHTLTVLPFSTPVGLNLPPDFSIVAWAGYARAISIWEMAGQFWLGDLMLYAQSKGADYDQEATQIAADLKFSPKTLQNCMYLAKRFPAPLRRSGVDFSFYREVASLPDKEALTLLENAIANDWTARELGAEVRKRKSPKKVEVYPTEGQGGDGNSNGPNGQFRASDDNARAVEVERCDVHICTPCDCKASAAPHQYENPTNQAIYDQGYRDGLRDGLRRASEIVLKGGDNQWRKFDLLNLIEAELVELKRAETDAS